MKTNLSHFAPRRLGRVIAFGAALATLSLSGCVAPYGYDGYPRYRAGGYDYYGYYPHYGGFYSGSYWHGGWGRGFGGHHGGWQEGGHHGGGRH